MLSYIWDLLEVANIYNEVVLLKRWPLSEVSLYI